MLGSTVNEGMNQSDAAFWHYPGALSVSERQELERERESGTPPGPPKYVVFSGFSVFWTQTDDLYDCL